MTNSITRPRRVVIGPGRNGTDVAYEQIATSVDAEAVAISDIWLTRDGTKAADSAPGADPWSLLPAEHGTTWRILEFKAGNAPEDITTGMHDTPTVDMGIILTGRILLVLADASTVELTAGDFFVLRGIQHTWVNAAEQSCVMSIVLVRTQ